jgi:hypothetical protein
MASIPRLARALFYLWLLIVLLNWKLLFTTQFTVFESPDASYQMLPWYQFASDQLQSGEFPLWERHLWLGQPLAGQVQPTVFSPLNLVLYLLPHNEQGHIQQGYLHGYFVLLHLLAATAALFLAREAGASPPASVLAGLIYTAGGYVGNIHWFNLLQSTVYAPLVLTVLLRIWKQPQPSPRLAAWGGLWLGLSWLSGHHNIPILLTLCAACFAAARLWQALREDRLRVILTHSLLLIASFGIAAVQILPAVEYGKLATRWIGDQSLQWNQIVPYSTHTQLSFQPRGLLGIALPLEHHQFVPYLGLTVLLLAAFGVRAFGFSSLPLLLTGAAALLYALGGYTVFHGLWYVFVPFVEKARWPGTALVLFHAAAAVFAGLGLDALSRGGGPRESLG